MKRGKHWSRLMVICISVMMVLSLMPSFVFADATDTPDAVPTETVLTDGAEEGVPEESVLKEDIDAPAAAEPESTENTEQTDAALPKAAPRLLGAGDTRAGGNDLSAYATVTDFTATIEATGTQITLLDEPSENPDDYPSKIGVNTGNMMFLVDWGLDLPDGQTISAGDTVRIPINTSFTYSTSQPSPLYDKTGTQIGEWNVTGSAITVTFNESAAGMNEVSGAQFDTQSTFYFTSTAAFNYEYRTITFGNLTKYACRNKRSSLVPARGGDGKSYDMHTNSMIRWLFTVSGYNVFDLWQTQGQQAKVLENYIIEDTFIGAKAANVTRIAGFICFPVDIDDPEQGTINNWSASNTVTSQFTKITPNEGETQEEFRARVVAQPLSYGVYNPDNKDPYLVINMGDVGNNGLKYTEANLTSAVQYAISDGHIGEEDYERSLQMHKTSYGEGNAVNGHIPSYRVFVEAEYDPIYGEAGATLPYSNTDTKSWVDNGEPVEIHREANAMLVATGSTITLDSDSVGITKVDSETGLYIEGAKFKLQLKNGNSWEDYTPGDGGEAERVTPENGTVIFGALGQGEYRVVETEAAPGYDLSKTEGYSAADGVAYADTFTIDADTNEGVQITVENTKATVDIVAQKVWDDSSNKYGKRSEVTFHLMQATGNGDPEVVPDQDKTVSGSNLTARWNDMPAFDEEGNEITYSVEEENVRFYTAKVEEPTENQFKITNTIVVDEVTLEDKTVPYDGDPHSLDPGVSEQGGTVLYSTDQENWSSTMPEFTDVGEYTIYAKTNDGDDFVGSEVTSAVLTITAVPLTVEITGNNGTLTYNGSEQSVTGYTVSIPEGATLTEEEITGPAEAAAKGTDVDGGSNEDKTYPMGLSADDFSTDNKNYIVTFTIAEDGWLKITPAELSVTITGNNDTLTYNGSEQSVTGYTVSIPEGATLTEEEITGPAQEDAAAKGTDVDGGSNEDKTYPMGLSADDFSTDNTNYIVTFVVEDGWLKITPAPATEANKPSADSGAAKVSKTGDESHFVGFAVVALLSAAAIAGLIAMILRRRRSED